MLITIILLLVMIPINTYASKTKVKLNKCIDGDTISILINKEEKKVRLIAVDSPEIDKEEPYSIEAREFTCNLLSNSKNVYLEYDKNADKFDKYERILAWVWADNTLVQKELVKNGFARVAYLYNEYKYSTELKEFEVYAQNKKLNIWSDYTKDNKSSNLAESKVKSIKSKTDKLLDKLNKSYEIIVIILAGILALITLYIKRKK